jgi:O-acetyl-ADP-ribose deacetylase
MIDVVHADITTLDVDAIVNAANPTLRGGGGVDGAIHRAAGPELARVAGGMAPCPTGDAVITPGFNLRAKFVIHAVGPIWRGGSHDESELLRRAYERSFALAEEQSAIRSIAFPAISTGAYGFPKPAAARIAIAIMREHEASFGRIVACLYDDESVAIYSKLLAERRP